METTVVSDILDVVYEDSDGNVYGPPDDELEILYVTGSTGAEE